ncbi:hypothetical protein M422DRAFT_248480 [Sphaerobolus stellatus SS14]|uniref:Arrestin-like N-terminal domain-containing protein n=1 Tax=Sphaerobolus stellatus (strain SS14) TaxID=990650 RepID=A0A0C9VVY3_SPHS4|nr:hypothetical protein M422DRAFT_248480 [Sphaerobolus stellatus SS14]
MSPPVITISLPKGLCVPGEQVSGILNVNVELAKEKGVEELKVSLRGEINTWVTTSDGNNDTTHRDTERLLEMTCTLWKEGDPVPSHTSGIASFPFTFEIPNRELPPSFYGGRYDNGGAVIYYVHAVGVRQKWYKINIRVDEIFPFIPFDTSPAAFYPVPSWNSEWGVHQNSDKVRKGLFSHSGLVNAAIILPTMPTIPLFKPIPIKIKVTCRSKPLPISAADDPASFEFPRNPKVSDVDLTLHQRVKVKQKFATQVIEDDLGLQAGFGLPENVRERDKWGKNVEVAISLPSWTINKEDPKKGY